MQVPLEPSPSWMQSWWPVTALGFLLAGVLAYRWFLHVNERQEKDRTNIHDIRNQMARQDGKMELLEGILHRIIDKLFDRKEKP